jgi:hypothetical protein
MVSQCFILRRSCKSIEIIDDHEPGNRASVKIIDSEVHESLMLSLVFRNSNTY